MREEHKYFISYHMISNNLFMNDEIVVPCIESMEDIDKIQKKLKETCGEECIIINYRMF